MNIIDRYEEYKDDGIDNILLKIKRGIIKAGRYANLVKIDKNFKVEKGRLFYHDEPESKSE